MMNNVFGENKGFGENNLWKTSTAALSTPASKHYFPWFLAQLLRYSAYASFVAFRLLWPIDLNKTLTSDTSGYDYGGMKKYGLIVTCNLRLVRPGGDTGVF